MSISVLCSDCGKRAKAPDQAAGRTLKCPACGSPVVVPPLSVEEIDPSAILLGDDVPASQSISDKDSSESSYGLNPQYNETGSPERMEPPTPPKKSVFKQPSISHLPPLTTNDQPFWRRHLHWLLVLAMIPLATSLLAKKADDDILERLSQSLESAPPEVQIRFMQAIDSEQSVDELISILPGGKLKGAWLPRSTFTHWGLALIAIAVYLAFFMFLASDGSARPLHVLAVGLFTATIGVGFLLIIQAIASYTDGRIVVGRSVLVLIFYVFKFIAFSYGAAANPENGFILSFVGFTLGVGLMEELVKMIPLFRHEEPDQGKAWRSIFIWGLASGAGFGIAEGILYSSRYYNGILGADIYLVRFLSCVALHAIWSGSVAITMYLQRHKFEAIDSWQGFIGPVLAVIAVPMILHGLYDTCLKREMNGAALVVALVSFAWLAFLSSRLYGTDDAQAQKDMLAEYQRRKKIIA